MSFVATMLVHHNPDGTTRASLVDALTRQPIEEFDKVVTIVRTDDALVMMVENLDGTQQHVVGRFAEQDQSVFSQAATVMRDLAAEAGYTVDRVLSGEDLAP